MKKCKSDIVNMNFLTKEDREKIEILNRTLGTEHRSKPYDFKSPSDIIEATVMATAEFCDMVYYSSTIEDIINRLDESMEIFYPAEWIKYENTTNKNFRKADLYLSKAVNALEEMVNAAEKRCVKMWSIVFFNSPTGVRQHFFGEEIYVSHDIIKIVLEEQLLDVYNGMEYNGAIEDTAKNFADALKEKIYYYENRLLSGKNDSLH